jgi:predicted homoserine dehydrogenase-like protein
MYGMEVVRLSAVELEAFRQQTRVVYGKWAEKIGIDLVGSADRIVQSGKY